MNILCASTLLVLSVSFAVTESRYPYEDAYRPGDIVPYANDRRHDRYPISGNRGGYPVTGTRAGYPLPGIRGGYPLPGIRGYPIPGITGGLRRDLPYDRPYESNRRRRTHLPPRGLGNGYKRNYDNYDYDYGKYRRSTRNRGPGLYSNDDFSYGDYSD